MRGWGDCPGLSTRTLCYHKDSPYRVKGGELESENDVVMDAVVQVGQRAKECRKLLEAGKGKGGFSLEPEGAQPCRHLGFNPVRPILAPFLRTVRLFKALSLWTLSATAIRN